MWLSQELGEAIHDTGLCLSRGCALIVISVSIQKNQNCGVGVNVVVAREWRGVERSNRGQHRAVGVVGTSKGSGNIDRAAFILRAA